MLAYELGRASKCCCCSLPRVCTTPEPSRSCRAARLGQDSVKDATPQSVNRPADASSTRSRARQWRASTARAASPRPAVVCSTRERRRGHWASAPTPTSDTALVADWRCSSRSPASCATPLRPESVMCAAVPSSCRQARRVQPRARLPRPASLTQPLPCRTSRVRRVQWRASATTASSCTPWQSARHRSSSALQHDASCTMLAVLVFLADALTHSRAEQR
mmetsp:Transcript_21783/g.54785  ORF Transcript_21783/g.54785 Transcript_21783/m.54785 type:complete len:220 (+) Transcript_21783:235-894(+)